MRLHQFEAVSERIRDVHALVAGQRLVLGDSDPRVVKPLDHSRKAHPALLVKGLPGMIERLRNAGIAVAEDEPLAGYDRVYVTDPFGNRLELMEPHP